MTLDSDKRLVQKIVDSYSASSSHATFLEYVVGRLVDLNNDRLELNKWKKTEEEENKRHADAIKEIQDAFKRLRARCSHLVRTFQCDPSGNNDSFHTCDICGKIL